MSSTHISLIAGVLAGLFFQLILSAPSLGVLLVFLPSLILFSIGFWLGIKMALRSTGIALLTIAIAGGGNMLGGLVHFTLMHALPLLYFVHRAMLWREVEGKRYWFPVGNVLATLALYFAGILLMVFVISDMGDGWLKTAIDKELDQEWATANPEQAKLLEKSPIGREFLFYIALAIASWIWILMMYAMAVCANTLLISMQKNTRPDLRLEQFRIPPYFLMVLGGCAIVSVVTEGHSGYMSKALLITLMLPYFLSGLRVIHALVRGTQWETAALVTLYVSLPFFIWLVPALVLLGMAYQCNLLAYWPKAIK